MSVVADSRLTRIRLPELLPEPLSHYTDAVRAADTLWVSGLLAFDSHGRLVGGADVVAQTEQVLRNLEQLLMSCGAGFVDVVKVVVYLTDITARGAVNEVRKRYFGDARPASTLVEVSALVIPEALVEIDTVAYLGGRP